MQAIVSVIIKALNEEEKIAKTVESALRAISRVGGEVILADSHSTDRTVEIAAQYPVKIVRLVAPEERSCGIGAQLGYQVAVGQYLWVVDGDMELAEDYIEQAISCLQKNERLAGVSGRVVEKNLESLEFKARVARSPINLQPGIVDRLDGGGVYKREAIESVGYLTNRNLHAYEEFELAARLRTKGWLLERIPVDAVFHFGHKTEAFHLLIRRWKSKYVCGIGELLRSVVGRPELATVVKEVRELWLYSSVVLWWLLMLMLIILALSGFISYTPPLVVLLIPLILMTIKKRSFHMALFSLTSWNFYTAGLLRGLFSSQTSPVATIKAELIIGEPD